MKFNLFLYWLLPVFIILTLTSCEQNIRVESVVHADGSVDRTIAFVKADSLIAKKNFFGIDSLNGWEIQMKKSKEDSLTTSTSAKLDIAFRKKFDNVEQMNAELDAPVDTLFRIHSDFQKQFRWFYTYISYSDTYKAINKFQTPEQSLYFTEEDYAFIDRLPAEGKPISHADSLYLVRLNEKIFDIYAAQAFYDEYYNAMIDVARDGNIEARWIDTLQNQKSRLFNHLMEKNDNDFDDDFMLGIADSLKIPLTAEMKTHYQQEIATRKKRIDFMSAASETSFVHSIKMPWDVVETNADSIHNNELYWHPPVTKFLLKDLTMRAESRQLNYWTLIVSGLFIVVTIVLWLRRGRNQIDSNNSLTSS